jgi:hypothetical protein
MTDTNDKAHYAAVARELSEGKIDAGLMTKAFAESNGNKPLSEALYLKMRVAELRQAQKILEHHRAKNLRHASAWEKEKRQKAEREKEEEEYKKMGFAGKSWHWFKMLWAALFVLSFLFKLVSCMSN